MEKVRKQVFHKHINNVTKKGGKNSRKIFPETQISQANNDEKNRLEKVRKHVFYKHTNIVTKKWGKKREKIFFQKHTYIAR